MYLGYNATSQPGNPQVATKILANRNMAYIDARIAAGDPLWGRLHRRWHPLHSPGDHRDCEEVKMQRIEELLETNVEQNGAAALQGELVARDEELAEVTQPEELQQMQAEQDAVIQDLRLENEELKAGEAFFQQLISSPNSFRRAGQFVLANGGDPSAIANGFTNLIEASNTNLNLALPAPRRRTARRSGCGGGGGR